MNILRRFDSSTRVVQNTRCFPIHLEGDGVVLADFLYSKVVEQIPFRLVDTILFLVDEFGDLDEQESVSVSVSEKKCQIFTKTKSRAHNNHMQHNTTRHNKNV